MSVSKFIPKMRDRLSDPIKIGEARCTKGFSTIASTNKTINCHCGANAIVDIYEFKSGDIAIGINNETKDAVTYVYYDSEHFSDPIDVTDGPKSTTEKNESGIKMKKLNQF